MYRPTSYPSRLAVPTHLGNEEKALYRYLPSEFFHCTRLNYYVPRKKLAAKLTKVATSIAHYLPEPSMLAHQETHIKIQDTLLHIIKISTLNCHRQTFFILSLDVVYLSFFLLFDKENHYMFLHALDDFIEHQSTLKIKDSILDPQKTEVQTLFQKIPEKYRAERISFFSDIEHTRQGKGRLSKQISCFYDSVKDVYGGDLANLITSYCYATCSSADKLHFFLRKDSIMRASDSDSLASMLRENTLFQQTISQGQQEALSLIKYQRFGQ